MLRSAAVMLAAPPDRRYTNSRLTSRSQAPRVPVGLPQPSVDAHHPIALRIGGSRPQPAPPGSVETVPERDPRHLAHLQGLHHELTLEELESPSVSLEPKSWPLTCGF